MESQSPTKVIDTNFSLHAKRIPEVNSLMSVYHGSALCYTDSSLSCDTFNIIHIFDGERLSANELDNALSHFISNKKDFCLWVNEENLNDKVKQKLTDHSLSVQNEEIGMSLDLSQYTSIQQAMHENIKIVSTVAMVEDYALVIAKNWTPTDTNVLKYYKLTAHDYLEHKGIFLLTYYHQQTPVSTVELFATDIETIGLYGFATLEEYRGQGLGSALMTYALNMVKALGYKTAILQATEDGIGIYKRYGFKEHTRYFEFA